MNQLNKTQFNPYYNPVLSNVFPAVGLLDLTDVAPDSYVGQANNILAVNPVATGVDFVSPSSIIPPVIGTGTAFDIPVFSGSVPPIFSDSGVNINPFDGSITGMNSITTNGQIYIGPLTLPDTGNIVDLDLSTPHNQTIAYDTTNNIVILAANANGGQPADLIIANGQTGNTGSNNIVMVNNNAGGANILSAPVNELVATTGISINESTDSHQLNMSGTGVSLICGNSLPLSIVTLGNPGTVGDVLTLLTGGAGWAPASSGGSLPTYTSQSVNPTMFGSSSDATMGFGSSLGTAPTFYWPCGLPWPCDPNMGTFAPSAPWSAGTVPFTLVPGNYAACLAFLGNAGMGIAQFTITNAGGGSPTVTNFDCYTSNTNNPQLNAIIQFTVSGTGYQNILINITCNSKNGSSSGYCLLPCSDLVVSPVYTL